MQGIYLVEIKCPNTYMAVVRFNTPRLAAPYHTLLCSKFRVLSDSRRARAIRLKKPGYQYYYLNKKLADQTDAEFWANMTEVFGVAFLFYTDN